MIDYTKYWACNLQFVHFMLIICPIVLNTNINDNDFFVCNPTFSAMFVLVTYAIYIMIMLDLISNAACL